MEVIAVAAAEAKAAAEERAAGAPPKRPLGRPRKEPVLVLGMARRTAWSDGDGAHGACMIEEQAEEKGEWVGQLNGKLHGSSCAGGAHGATERVALLSFGWCWRGGCWSELQMVDRANKITRARID
jgi:hypothetical protein